VFVSCGQHSERERSFAAKMKSALEARGFLVYVAIAAQSIEDVNAGIIRQLERSDYYLFVDFRREQLDEHSARGSLFTHQELAIAHRTGFEQALFFQEEGTRLEGLLRYMGGNAVRFGAETDLVERVLSSVSERGWSPRFSRHLIAARIHDLGGISTPQIKGRFFAVDIENRRADLAAYGAIARLERLRSASGSWQRSPNRSPLKVDGQAGFGQVIWPEDHGAFDIMAVGAEPPHGIHLFTSLDLLRIDPLASEPGEHELEYAVLAAAFPVLRFTVAVHLTGDPWTSQVALL